MATPAPNRVGATVNFDGFARRIKMRKLTMSILVILLMAPNAASTSAQCEATFLEAAPELCGIAL
jgi:hypothetical protein